MKNELYFISSNVNKINEIRNIFPNDISLLSLKDLDWFDEIPEDYNTFIENSKQKVNTVISKFNVNAFADDSGLEVYSLNNNPGVHSARYAKINNSELDNVDYLLEKMKNIENRKARFICYITLYWKGRFYTFDGFIEGEILTNKRGSQGFAYDSVFLPDGETKSFAEMDIHQKNLMSHRFIAVNKMLSFLKENKYV